MLTALLAALFAGAALPAAHAQERSTPAVPAPENRPVIEPEVDRRPVRLPRFPSKDFSVGVFSGTYATESFGTNRVSGLRAGYFINEDIFIEAVVGSTRVRDENYRVNGGNGVFPTSRERLLYYNGSVGYNVLPGEVFFGSKIARPSGVYVIGGLGTTRLASESHQTVNFGLGVRLFMADWAAIQVDLRDHIFALDVLGRRQSTQNIEFTLGASFYF